MGRSKEEKEWGRWDKKERRRPGEPGRYPDTLKISRVSEAALYLSTGTLAWASDKEGPNTQQASCPSPGLDAP